MPEYPRALQYQPPPGEGFSLQRVRFYLFCALLALLAVAGALLLGASYWQQQLGDLKNMLPANVDMRLGRMTLSESGQNGQTLVIEAASAMYNQADDFFILHDVQAKISPGPEFYDITAEAGRYDQSQKIITLTGRVKVVGSDGGILLSEQLVLNLEDGLLICETSFCYTDPESDLEGSAFVYNTRDRHLDAEGPVRFQF
jgi:LPS export ABC transporter protein LptC